MTLGSIVLISVYTGSNPSLIQVSLSNTPKDRLTRDLITFSHRLTLDFIVGSRFNNQNPEFSELQRTNVFYEFTYKTGDCERQNNSYISMTMTTLSRRLTMHNTSGAIKVYMKSRHHRTVTREELQDNTEILRAETDFIRLRILEALYIQEKCPTLNQQATGNQRTLKLHNFSHTQNHTQTFPQTSHRTHIRRMPRPLNPTHLDCLLQPNLDRLFQFSSGPCIAWSCSVAAFSRNYVIVKFTYAYTLLNY